METDAGKNKSINDADLSALINACLDQKMTYGGICKEVRAELRCDLRSAIGATDRGLRLVGERGKEMLAIRQGNGILHTIANVLGGIR